MRDRASRRLPPWLTKRLSSGGNPRHVQAVLDELGLDTVCRGAHCPNQAECFACGTATFMILGDRCTRACRFCAIPHTSRPKPPRPDEPQAVAQAARKLGLRHVVVTSVTRDDLADGGAGHFAQTIREVRSLLPDAAIEVLTPDFQGRLIDVDTVIDAAPDVFNHNLETVPRLYAQVRPQAHYNRSLSVLAHAARRSEQLSASTGRVCTTKSGLMVGLGETPAEVSAVLADLRAADVRIVTIGQYLAPSADHLPVVEFVQPGQFEAWRSEAMELGFKVAACGPFVRSSYHAAEVFDALETHNSHPPSPNQ